MDKEGIKKLAQLARLSLTEEEAEKYTAEIGPILKYVESVKEIAKGTPAQIENAFVQSVMREDVQTNESNEYTADILKNSPDKDGNWVKVQQILKQ